MSVEIDLDITESAKQMILKLLARVTHFESVPALVWMTAGGSSEPCWMVRFYERSKIDSGEIPGVLTVVGGIELLIPQPQVAERLRGRTLAWVGDGFDVVARSNH